MHFRLRSKAVIHELLDNEIILADLDTGIYYSLRGSGIPIWQGLVAGHDLSSICRVWNETYGESSLIFDSFIKQLETEQLIVSSMPPTASLLPFDVTWPYPYQPPLLEKYEEMKNLLMLDPIHEVDEQGWPVKSEFV